MPSAVPPETRTHARRAVAFFALALGALTAWRWAGLYWSQAELFVDEAQYWLWGQSVEFGYYSKPPLIGWVIRAFTDMAGSDAAFWVRFPAPLFHAVTACVIAAIAWRFAPPFAAVLAGLAYATMPGIAIGSFLISTDTILLPFFALAVGLWLSLMRAPSMGLAALLGLSLGLGMLAKYAAIYFLLGAVLSALFIREARIAWRDAVVAGVIFLITISPNIWWNLTHGLSTLDHTLDNVDWVRDPGGRRGLNWDSLAEFIGGQFAFFGPILFGALLVMLVRRGGLGGPRERALILMSVPIILLVCVQALLSRAYANWAAPAYVAATLLVVPYLWARAKGWLTASFVVNALLSVALPGMLMMAGSLSLDGERLLAERYLGRGEMSEAIFAEADARGLSTIVSDNRDILADLMYREGTRAYDIYSTPPVGKPRNHYAMNFALPDMVAGDVLFVSRSVPEGCDAGPLTRLQFDTGAYRGRAFIVTRVPAACLR